MCSRARRRLRSFLTPAESEPPKPTRPPKLRPAPDDLRNVKLFCEFVKDRTETEIPDPYFAGDEGFETVLDLVENGCAEILRTIPV